MTSRRRSPRPLAVALDVVRDQLAPDTVLAAVQQCWRDAVGEAVAANATPTGERAGVLTVACAASVWAQELDLMGPMVTERLNHLLGGRQIVRLRCVSLPA